MTLLIDLENPNILTASGMVEMQSQNYYSYREYYQSQVEILTSYGLAKKCFDDFNLGSTPAYKNAKEPVVKFLKTVKVEPIRDTRLLKLSVDNKDPELAAKIAAGTVERATTATTGANEPPPKDALDMRLALSVQP